MSGSEHARPARCIWLTSDQRDDLARLVNDYLGHALSETPLAVVDAWDAAPADPAEAVRDAISIEWMNTGMGNEERIDDVYNREGAAIYRTQAVLRALGHPKEPA